ncbi:MAG TPA: hypothetical protein VHN11_08240 [Xanthobacteraceae bacterium]|nr:hypothetical protein [Xanthobacteraceae bacterium]
MASDSGPTPAPTEIASTEILDRAVLRKTTDDLIEALTAPAYVEAMLAVRSAPEEHRLEEASRRLSPDALRKLGVPLPPDMRISSRYFETGFPDSIDVELGDPPQGGLNLINELNKVQPGLLDSLHTQYPDIYQALVAQSANAGLSSPITRIGTCQCGGAIVTGPFGIGHGTACGGAGLYL